ncbi:MAG: Fur family transcriptional regulator [Bacillota bacterium]|jgi:Fur family ferric uptake transcriptional regulator
MPDLLSRARQKFALHGHKWTGQRREIVAVLDEDQSLHLSAEELHGILQERGQKIGLATVYRTLELMVDMGLIHKLQFGDNRSRFEVADEEHHHHHLVCNVCGKVYEVSWDLLEELEHKIEADHDFSVQGHHLKFYGICSACKRLGEDERG